MLRQLLSSMLLLSSSWACRAYHIHRHRPFLAPTVPRCGPLPSGAVSFCRLYERQPSSSSSSSTTGAFDVEFERVTETQEGDDEHDQDVATDSTKRPEKSDMDKTLLDLALDADPEWKEIRVPFTETETDQFIECRVAIMTELDGVVYGIGLPFDHPVVLTITKPDGESVAIEPDDDDNQELLAIMAKALREHLGSDLNLRRTPRVLTIEGDLDKYTSNYQEEVFGRANVDTETLMDDSDETIEDFMTFMKNELGEEEFQKTMDESELSDFDSDLLKYFDFPGLGLSADDDDGIEQSFKNLYDIEAQAKEIDELCADVVQDGVSLRLVGFHFKDGNVYSLAKPLKQYTIVGKMSAGAKDLQFDILTSEEEKLIIPRLEEACKDQFAQAGLQIG